MNTQQIQQAEELTKQFEQDYYSIVKDAPINQWAKSGDGFEIFTLYNDTTPVVASSHSEIIK